MLLLLLSFIIASNKFLFVGADFASEEVEDAFIQNLFSEKYLVAASVVFLNQEMKRPFSKAAFVLR
jgi:hypothetical protein